MIQAFVGIVLFFKDSRFYIFLGIMTVGQMTEISEYTEGINKVFGSVSCYEYNTCYLDILNIGAQEGCFQALFTDTSHFLWYVCLQKENRVQRQARDWKCDQRVNGQQIDSIINRR